MIWFAVAIIVWKEALDVCKAATMLANRNAASASYVAANRDAVSASQLAASNHLASQARQYALTNRTAIENNREKQQ